MYMAKAAGRGCVEIFEDEMFEHVVEQADLENELRLAIAAGDITVHYQPVVDVPTGNVTGVEALARWQHPTRGLLPPDRFIPLAEATGLIVPLGRLVLETACLDAARWRRHDPTLTVAVNVSARQLGSGDLVHDVRAALAASGLPPQALILEITESVLVNDFETTRRQLDDVKALGISLAIDDFGTGYSSLSYLRHLPFDILKIDRSFIDQLPGEGTSLARSIVRLADSLNLSVVAEGVEQTGQLEELTRLGCQHAQGYLFARPQASAAIDELIRTRSAGYTPTPAALGTVEPSSATRPSRTGPRDAPVL